MESTRNLVRISIDSIDQENGLVVINVPMPDGSYKKANLTMEEAGRLIMVDANYLEDFLKESKTDEA